MLFRSCYDFPLFFFRLYYLITSSDYIFHTASIDNKTLNETLADKFEGNRLRLKMMKEKGLVDFEGIVPSFNSKIRLKD